MVALQSGAIRDRPVSSISVIPVAAIVRGLPGLAAAAPLAVDVGFRHRREQFGDLVFEEFVGEDQRADRAAQIAAACGDGGVRRGIEPVHFRLRVEFGRGRHRVASIRSDLKDGYVLVLFLKSQGQSSRDDRVKCVAVSDEEATRSSASRSRCTRALAPDVS